MEILINMALVIAALGTTGAGVKALRTAAKHSAGNLFSNQLKNTVFAPVATMNAETLAVQAPPLKLSLEAQPETKELNRVVTATEYVKISQISGELRTQALKVAENLTEAQGYSGLTVEQEHELGAVKDSLFVILKAYDAFTPSQRNSAAIQENITEQLTALNEAIENCKHNYEEDQLRTLNANKLFIQNKFTSESLNPSVATSPATI